MTMKKILIVESPSKAKTIEGYLKNEYQVLSSVGHIRDLSTKGKKGLGVDIDNKFKPIYEIIPEKAKTVNELKTKCQGNKVYLATDPDREGEAISWHLAQVLGLSLEDDNRVVFNEITKNAIVEALEHPRKIDMELTESQETRRILDRIIGFELSGLMKSKIKSESAGRVQSVALKLIVDREKEINAFIPEEYYTIDADFTKFKVQASEYKGSKLSIKSENECNKYLDLLTDDFTVKSVEEKESKRESKPPYITSTLQQDASSKLNFDSTKTMRIAQILYEGKEVNGQLKGLITYMRTDSDRLSDAFVQQAYKYIEETYGKQYLGKKKHKNVALSQDAHEAIRPTYITNTPESLKEYLTNDEYKLYTLIYNRALASLMAPTNILVTSVVLDNNGLIFKTKGEKELFDGYTKLTGNNKLEYLPELKVGDILHAKEVSGNKHFTLPPARYTEATLIKEMEEKGIGRPSTYAETIRKNKSKKYIKTEKRQIEPTDKGILTISKLDEYFSDIINVEFTANMEHDLDRVAQSDVSGEKIISDFYPTFEEEIAYAKKNMDTIVPTTGNICPICGSPLVMRKSKYGEFEACSAYPKCKFVVSNEMTTSKEIEDMTCPLCKVGQIVVRISKKGKTKGKEFYACNNFPKCTFTSQFKPNGELCPICGKPLVIDDNNQVVCSNPNCGKLEEELKCPDCKTGTLILRTAKKGSKSGNSFYGCSNYPKCKFVSQYKPTTLTCPKCGKRLFDVDGEYKCLNKDCK
ncbi:MAG: type I DNA topoisomerase [Acholeplasmatales bacterium]|nr:type I DNA topoisomerase [Acholeplasmatales bacterium]